jgi:hypothetical protein
MDPTSPRTYGFVSRTYIGSYERGGKITIPTIIAPLAYRDLSLSIDVTM